MKNVIKKNKCDGIVEYNIIPTEEEMKKGYQYINFDIYPKIMEDEYKELRELAKSQQRLTQGVKLTVRLKEFATKVADIPFDFTTKSILFSALKYSGSARSVANAFSEIFTDIKNDTESNTFSDMKDVYADYNQLSYEDYICCLCYFSHLYFNVLRLKLRRCIPYILLHIIRFSHNFQLL